MANMLDGNTAALRKFMARDDAGAAVQEEAEAKRSQLVADYIADTDSKNDEHLHECLVDCVANDAAFLHGLQRIHAIAARPLTPESSERIAAISVSLLKMFVAYVDHVEGDDLVNAEADEIAAHVPCRCRGDCTC